MDQSNKEKFRYKLYIQRQTATVIWFFPKILKSFPGERLNFSINGVEKIRYMNIKKNKTRSLLLTLNKYQPQMGKQKQQQQQDLP